jgi:hypothetical protein
MQIHVIDCCHKCNKSIDKPTDIYKEIDKRIKYCSKLCFDSRIPSYEENIIMAQERRHSHTDSTESFACTEDFIKIMQECARNKAKNDLKQQNK